MPTQAMIKAGNDWASHATDAHIAKCMGELGSTKEQRDWQLSNFENVDLIQMYLNGEIDSVTGIYMAMEQSRISVHRWAVVWTDEQGEANWVSQGSGSTNKMSNAYLYTRKGLAENKTKWYREHPQWFKDVRVVQFDVQICGVEE